MNLSIQKKTAFLLTLLFFLFTFQPAYTHAEAKVKLSHTTLTLGIGELYSLQLLGASSYVIWSSSNELVAEVNNGLLFAKKKGTTTISASYKEKTYTCKITVKDSYLKTSELYLTVGTSYKILKSTPKGSYYWFNSNSIDVSETGTITANDVGPAYLTYYIGGKEYNCNIYIISQEVNSANVYVNDTSIYTSKENNYEFSLDQSKWYLNTLKGLESETEYKVYYRIAKTATKKAGKSKSMFVSTTAPVMIVPITSNDQIPPSRCYQHYWSQPEDVYYYTDSKHLVSVMKNKDCKKLTIQSYSADLKLKDTKVIDYIEDEFGGFYHSDDGSNYLALGNTNLKENKNAAVYIIYKYNSNWELLGSVSIKGSECTATRPFDAGNCRMLEQNHKLVMYTTRERYRSEDGLHHQSNYMAVIDTQSLTLLHSSDPFPRYHVSHSFRVYALSHENDLILVDHGDGYPRAVYWQDLAQFFDDRAEFSDEYYGNNKNKYSYQELFSFMGKCGDNYTGTTIGCALQLKDTTYIVGSSVPHSNPVSGTTGYNSILQQNIYLTTMNCITMESSFHWLTDYDPKGKISAGTPRMLMLDDDQFAILFAVNSDSKSPTTCCLIIDSSCNIVSTKYYNVSFSSNSDPIIYNNSIVWIDAASSISGYQYAWYRITLD